MRFYILAFLFLFIVSCREENSTPIAKDTINTIDREKEITEHLQLLKDSAQDGDLIVRLNDDFVSEQLRMFNEKDKAFSHSGIIVTKGGQKTVCSILPTATGFNPLTYIPIDSFLDKKTNTACGLFRYNITETEKSAFLNNINSLATKPIYFDSVINLQTDDSLYCSEMIYKAMKKATNNRIDFKVNTMPKKMQPAVYKFYNGRLSRETLAKKKIIFIDNLYLIPQCREIIRFKLKYFPGQE